MSFWAKTFKINNLGVKLELSATFSDKLEMRIICGSLLLIFSLNVFGSSQSTDHVSQLERKPDSIISVNRINALDNHVQRIEASNERISLRYQLFRPINALATDAPAKIIHSGVGRVLSTNLKSNQAGEIQVLFIPGQVAGEALIKVESGRASIEQKIQINEPINYQTQISKKNSSIIIATPPKIADDSSSSIILLKLRDHDNKAIIPNRKLEIDWSSRLGQIKPTENQMQAQYFVGRNAGQEYINISVEGIELTPINFELATSINYQSFVITKQDLTDVDYKLQIKLEDSFNRVINDLSQIKLEAKLGDKIIKPEVNNGLINFYTPLPFGEGKTTFELYINQIKHQLSIPIEYRNIKPDTNLSSFKHVPEQIIANGYDQYELLIELKDAAGNYLTQADPSFYELVSNNVKVKTINKLSSKQGIHFVFSLENTENASESNLQLMFQNKSFMETHPIKLNSMAKKQAYLSAPPYGEMRWHQGLRILIQRYQSKINEKIELIKMIGFSLQNNGINSIVPRGGSADAEGNVQASREFSFKFIDQANQNSHFEVTEDTTGFTSRFMLSHFILLPRKVLPSYHVTEDSIEVTLPTTEKIIFDKKSKEITAGVMQEHPVDMSASRFNRHFADIRYMGSGVLIRANARGNSPQIGQFSNTAINGPFGRAGEARVMAYYYDHDRNQAVSCLLDKKDLWPPIDQSPIPFRFATDQEVAKLLAKKCGAEFERRILD